jgi:hypothetical protein
MKIREQGPMPYLVSHEDYTHSLGGGGTTSSTTGGRLRQKSEDWTREEFGGQGHGYQSLVNKTKTTMAEHAVSIADARHTSHIGFGIIPLHPSSLPLPLPLSFIHQFT